MGDIQLTDREFGNELGTILILGDIAIGAPNSQKIDFYNWD